MGTHETKRVEAGVKGKWQHLLEKGEYAYRRKILSGLTLEQVTERPSPQLHSIYEELWHLVSWQHIVVHRDEERFASWEANGLYPSEQAGTIEEWHRLVDKFFADLETAYQWTSSPERLEMETDPGVTMEEVLYSLAVHSAYHFGKIVALRQMFHAWPRPNQ